MSTLVAGPCAPITGNDDLYGAGIRIGVYLQWFSSWLVMLVEPSAAQDVHDVNAVFVFAIVVATVLAARDRAIHPIEGYLMLQFSYGFFCTTVSILGLRLQLMTPRNLAALANAFMRLPSRLRESFIAEPFLGDDERNEEITRQKTGLKAASKPSSLGGLVTCISSIGRFVYAAAGAYLHHTGIMLVSFSLPMAAVSFLKPSSFSWSGVFFRAVIATMVASFNIWFWYYGIGALHDPERTSCVSEVFMFARLRFGSRLLNFFKATSIIVAVPAFTASLYLILVAFRLFSFFAVCIFRDVVHRTLQTAHAVPHPLGRSQTVDILAAVNPLLAPIKQSLELLSHSGHGHKISDSLQAINALTPEFWATPLSKIPRFSDMLKISAALAGAGVTSEVAGEPTVEVRRIHRIICFLWRAVTILAMIWFTISIELTISWNDIRGVNDIESTGQLIPFIIGVVSTIQAVKKVAIESIKKLYPDWADMELNAYQDLFGSIKFEIVEKKHEALQSASMPDLRAMPSDPEIRQPVQSQRSPSQ